MFLKQIEDGFDALLEKLFGSDLTSLPLEDEEFKEHIDANRMSLWLLVVMLFLIVIITTMAVYAVLETSVADMQLLSVFSVDPNIMLHSLPLSAVAFSFAIIWRNVFNNYAAKFHSDTLKRQNSRFFAAAAVFFALLASSIAFFADARLYGTMIMLFYLTLTFAFLFALIFSSKMYHLIRSVASRDMTSGASGVEAHQRFPALAHLTLGWCGTNALTTVAMVGFSAVLLSYYMISDSFHLLHVETDDDLKETASFLYGRMVWLELILLSIFLLMGFFSGTFRRKATADQFRAELLSLNSALDSSDGPGPAPSALEAAASIEGDEEHAQSRLDLSTGSKRLGNLLALSESSRLVSSAFISVLLFLSGGEFQLAIILFLFLTSSYLFNDLMDFFSGRDLLCHPDRPMPSGRLSWQSSATMTLLLTLVSLVLAVNLGTETLVLVIACYVISCIYSLFLKRLFPLIATPLWCAATVALFLASFDAGVVMYLIAFGVVFGRELLLEERDGENDQKLAKTRTFPEVLGQRLKPLSLFLISIGLLTAALQATTAFTLLLGVTLSILTIVLLVSSNSESLRERSKLVYFLALALPG